MGPRKSSYGELAERVSKLSSALVERGVSQGDRVAVLSENRLEYLEIMLAAASLGAIAACQNWRLAPPELQHCIDLVAPRVIFVSPRHRDKLHQLQLESAALVVEFGDEYEQLLQGSAEPPLVDVDPESGLLILYTSGTTGLPKGALISHRAEIVRNLVVRAEFGVAADEAFVAWSPLYHMGAADCALGALMSGGRVIVVDGFDRPTLADILERQRLGWLLLMPGMVREFADELERRGTKVHGVTVCGVMADLVPPEQIARITTLLGAPYANTFGATETGCPPCSSSLLEVGVVPQSLAKRQSPFCEVRLVDTNGHDVADGTPGELWMRGPTLFSGYWRAEDVNAEDFADGWFHMGDVFVRNADGSLNFVDRVKYLIKSGGENIYPAELERVLLAVPGVIDAAVVRCPDPKWGEVPVAFVAREHDGVDEQLLTEHCRTQLAGYKRPKAFNFIEPDAFPRSTSGKVQRHELEKRLEPRH